MMKSKWECPFERVREYPDCFQDCPDISACEMKDTWKQTRPLPKLKTTSFPIDIKHIQVIAFAKAMDEVLVKNDHKGGWQDCDINYLRFRLMDEIGEYFHAIASDPNYYPVKEELIDIANFAMMLWDRS
jgi:hypothetical protein